MPVKANGKRAEKTNDESYRPKAKEIISEINRLAEEYYYSPDKLTESGEINISFFNKVSSSLVEKLYYFLIVNGYVCVWVKGDNAIPNEENVQKIYDTFSYNHNKGTDFINLTRNCLKTFNPDDPNSRSYLTYFQASFLNVYRTGYAHEHKGNGGQKDGNSKKFKPPISLDAPKRNDDDDTTIGEMIPDTKQPYTNIMDCQTLLVLNEIIKEARHRCRKNQIWRYGYFYTEFVTRQIHTEPDPCIYEQIETKLTEEINEDFARFYLNVPEVYHHINSINSIAHSELKPLSDFREDCEPSKKCGYQLDNIVYIQYIEKNEHRTVSSPRISEIRSDFDELLKKIKSRIE